MNRSTLDKVNLQDLIMAYRKAKVDAFYETGHHTKVKFVEYEQHLFQYLQKLELKINNNEIEWFKSKEFVGGYTFTLKKVEVKNDYSSENNFFISSPYKHNKEIEEVDFRIIGDHSIDFHILSSLWIDKVGVYLESKISQNSYGCRLNYSIPIEDENIYTLDRKEVFSGYKYGHFRSYLIDYQRWQYNGLKEINKAIDEGKKVIAITADFKKYYHRIDCSFLQSEEFLKYIEMDEFTPIQRKLTSLLVTAYNSWNTRFNQKDTPKDFLHNDRFGIPIGLSASRVIANLLLAYLDKEIEKKIQYIYYGRYVDDIFIVIEDNGNISTPDDFWNFLKQQISNIQIVDTSVKETNEKIKQNSYQLIVPYSHKSFIEFSPGKERFFCLEGLSGKAFLQTLKESLDENSSEWNMPPNVEGDLESFSKEMTSASDYTKEPANGLRKADGISIKRLKFILYLKRFELAIDLLPEKCWSTTIESFLSLATEYAIIPENLATYSKYFPRLLSLAINSGKYQHGKDLIENINKGYDSLVHRFTGERIKVSALKKAKQHQINLLTEGIYTSIDPFKKGIGSSNQLKSIVGAFELDIKRVIETSKKLFYADLHRIPFKYYFLYPEKYKENIPAHFLIDWLFQLDANLSDSLNFDNTRLLLDKIANNREINNFHLAVPNSLYFFTRPFFLLELSLLIPDWYDVLEEFKKICKLFGYSNFGEKVSDFKEIEGRPDLIPISVPSFNYKSDKIFALTSLETKNASWVAIVRDENNDPDTDRNQRILDLSGDIIKCKLRKKAGAIDYVIFPELSIPRKLLIYLSYIFKNKEISIIAGLEYKINKPARNRLPKSYTGEAFNQLIYILCTGKKELPQQIALIQEKTVPAIHEERELFNVGGKILFANKAHKFLIEHGNFWFSGLICNDLLNINYRANLRGLIDALIIVEWNPDTETYDHLVSSAANDLHSFIIQVNNRYYGDTRLRGPYKESYERDRVRVRGGELDYFVITTVEVEKLREFQKNHRSPERPFKPVPTGFEMSLFRRDPNELKFYI